uniref:vWA domain-containing protein n=1 Tax=uncultured Halomonas sp. TaxID=173971 RepID=UPI00260EB2BF
MRRIASALAAMMVTGGLASAASASTAEDIVIVYDASGSMWGQIDGTSKIEIARDVMAELVNGWDADTHLGLVAYGHRRQGDCRDIETLVEPGPLDKTSFIDTVNEIQPVGKTPISASVQHAADLLSYRDTPSTVVLISDGVETCNADPCALSEQLARQGVKFTAHVVGFDLEDEAHASLSCIAENTGGLFVPARNADELHNALTQVKEAVEETPPAPEPKPEPEPEPTLPEASVSGPDQVVTGALFEASWSSPINASDMVGIVPVGADAGTRGNYQRTRNDTEGQLRAPADTGLYELRYILDEGKKTLATAPIEVVAPEVSVSGPDQVVTGALFEASWSSPINAS